MPCVRLWRLKGHYSAFEWEEEKQDFIVNDKMGIQVTVIVSVGLFVRRMAR